MGGDGKRGTGRVYSGTSPKKKFYFRCYPAVVIISNFHFIRDRPLYFLEKGGKRLVGVIFSLQEFLFVTVSFYLVCLFRFFLSVCFWRDSLCRFFFFTLKKYNGLSVTGDDHFSWWSYFRFTNDNCTRMRYITPLNPAVRSSPVFKPTQIISLSQFSVC